MPPSRINIADLEANQFIEGLYAIQNAQLGQTKAGKPYLKCLLADKSGRTPGRMWNISEQLFNELPQNGFVRIEGQTQPYQGEIQVIIQRISATEPTADQLTDLLPSTKYDVEEMYAELIEKLNTVKHMSLRYLIEAYVTDEELMDKFQQAPAAMTLHHAFLGGLLEHTLQLLRLAEAICPIYPEVNRDLVVTGLFLHDLAKCSELTWSDGFGYTDRGLLIGHVVEGAIWLQKKVDQLRASGKEFSDELLTVLQHIVISHHTQPEFGAAKIPATPEAIAIGMIDNLDAKLQMALAVRENTGAENSGSFSEKVWALDTRIYRPDPTATSESQTNSKS